MNIFDVLLIGIPLALLVVAFVAFVVELVMFACEVRGRG